MQRQYELAVGLHAEGNVLGAFKTLHDALEIDPTDPQVHQLLGTLYLVQRDEDVAQYDRLAEEHFLKALEYNGSAGKSRASLQADIYNGLGVLRLHQGRPRDALDWLEQAVDADPFNPKAYMALGNLGWAFEMLGQNQQAIVMLRRALRLNPGFCVGYFRLGKVLLSQRAYEAADEALTQAVEAHDQCVAFQDAWQLRGTARMSLGYRQDARRDFERCVELAPRSNVGSSCRRYLAAID